MIFLPRWAQGLFLWEPTGEQFFAFPSRLKKAKVTEMTRPIPKRSFPTQVKLIRKSITNGWALKTTTTTTTTTNRHNCPLQYQLYVISISLLPFFCLFYM